MSNSVPSYFAARAAPMQSVTLENKKNEETLSEKIGKVALPLILLAGVVLTTAASLVLPAAFLPTVPLALKCITLGGSALAIYSLLTDNSEYVPMEETAESDGCEEEPTENKATPRDAERAAFLAGVNLRDHAPVGARK